MKKIILLFASVIAIAACCQVNTPISVVPYPNEVSMGSGSIDIAGIRFNYSPELDIASKAYIETFAGQLSLATGKTSSVKESKKVKGISFISDSSLAKEAYTLDISRRAVKVKASSLNGFVYDWRRSSIVSTLLG